MNEPHLPLSRTRALIACSELKAGKLSSGLADLGAEVTVFPVISIVPVADKALLDKALERLESYDWMIFTSAYGVHFLLSRMEERGIPAERCDGSQICAVGPATADALRAAGRKISMIPAEYVAEGILAALESKCGDLRALRGLRILLPRAREARDVLPDTLRDHGALVDVVPCYESRIPRISPNQVQEMIAKPPGLVVFTSSSTVNNFITILGSEEGRSLLVRASVAVLGPITAGTLAAHGKKAEIMPPESTIASLLESIRTYFLRESGVGKAD